MVMRNLRDIFLYNDSQELNLELDVALENIMDGNIDSAYYHINNLILEELNLLPKQTDVRELYRFVGFPPLRRGKDISENEVIKDIREGRITLGNPMKFNDPMDPIIRVWIEKHCKNKTRDKNIQIMSRLINFAMNSFRICSLVREPSKSKFFHNTIDPFENTLMWSHYAKSHTGLCIKYKITPDVLNQHTDNNRILLLGDVRYREQKELNDYISLDNSLLAKSQSWEYEHETRLIFFTEDRKDLKYKNGKIRNFVPLCGFDVEAVYMGYRISNEYKHAVKTAIIGTNIQLYQMSFEQHDITKLVANQII